MPTKIVSAVQIAAYSRFLLCSLLAYRPLEGKKCLIPTLLPYTSPMVLAECRQRCAAFEALSDAIRRLRSSVTDLSDGFKQLDEILAKHYTTFEKVQIFFCSTYFNFFSRLKHLD